MMTLTIDEIILPETMEGEGADEFRALVDVRNAVEAGVLGTTAMAVTPAGVLPYFLSNPQRTRRHFVARVDDETVGRGLLSCRNADGATQAGIIIDVLPAHRRVGVGTALLERLESEAVAMGRSVFQSDQPHTPLPGGERLPSPTGFGDLPLADPGVRFFLRHGYELEMVARVSTLDPRSAATSIEVLQDEAAQVAGADYRVVMWSGPTPEDRLEDVARLKSGMMTDAPMAGMEVTPDPWDADRVRAHGERQLATGRTLLTAAAEHVPTGQLVAYTEIQIDEGDNPATVQEDTLVLRTHRGHRLGMLVKAANIAFLLRVAPTATVITTFNAEDNRPMLDVNEALGFAAIGLEGNWQKRV